jgi:hypothetical protein
MIGGITMWMSAIRRWDTALLAVVPLSLALLACGGGQNSSAAVKQMLTTVAMEESGLTQSDTWTVVPRAVVIVTTSGDSRLHAHFVAEAVGRVAVQPTQIIDVDNPETPGPDFQTVTDLFGTPVEVRILVDDEVMFPQSTQFTGVGTALATHSFLAIADDVEAGAHSVRVEWRSSRAGAFMRDRTLTVWETGRDEPPTP